MLAPELAWNKTMNIASTMVGILLRGQLLQNHLTLNLAMMKNKRV